MNEVFLQVRMKGDIGRNGQGQKNSTFSSKKAEKKFKKLEKRC
jgi:hypothetical protein